MNVGIIAEYNPFHRGHALHIANTRALTGADNIIAIMSGSFVQRGEPAAADKYARTRAALLNGVDMVLELPVQYATGSADIFAMGAVQTLNKSGITDILSFGSEEGDIELFKSAANLLANETPEFKSALKEELTDGTAFATAREKALTRVLSRDMSFLSKPNNILALEYLKALVRTKSTIKPVTIKRDNDYNSIKTTGGLLSAAAIRHSIEVGERDIAVAAVPVNCRDVIYNIIKNGMPTINSYGDILRYILLKKSPEELRKIDDVSEGIENRIIALAKTGTVTEIINAVKSKRYAHSRIRRIILHILLDIIYEDATAAPRYIRVLGVRSDKRELVSQLTKKSALPVITNVKNAPEHLLDKEIFATDMYNLPLNGERGKDYTEPLVIVQ